MLGLNDGSSMSESEYKFMSGSQDSAVPILSGVLLSFLHLRHLELRNLQHACLQHINFMVSVERNCVKMIDAFNLLDKERSKATISDRVLSSYLTFCLLKSSLDRLKWTK